MGGVFGLSYIVYRSFGRSFLHNIKQVVGQGPINADYFFQVSIKGMRGGIGRKTKARFEGNFEILRF